MPEAGVVAGAADLGEIPARSEVARAHLGVRLESAAREHDRLGADLHLLALVLRAHAEHAPSSLVMSADGGRLIEDLDAFALARLVLVIDQARAPAPGLGRQPAPEFVARAVVDLVRLAAVARLEFDALLAQPHQRLEAALDQDLAQVGIGAVLRDAAHVVVVGLGGVGAVVVGLLLLLGEIGNDLREVVHAVVHHAHQAAGVAAVAAAVVDRRGFQHDDAGAGLARGERRAAGRVARADDDDIGVSKVAGAHCFPFRIRDSGFGNQV